VAQATRELGAHLISTHVLEVEAAWARLARLGDWVGPGGLLHIAIAPLDIALWDAAGKTLGQPLYQLLGGYRDRLPAYASDGLWYSLSLEQLVESARQHVTKGFQAIKLRLGKETNPEVDIAVIDLARVGGITPWRRIAGLAQAYQVPVCGHVIPEIHVHLLAAIPNAFMVEYVPRSAAILRDMPVLEDGCLVAPKASGLGLDLDEAVIRRYRIG
jgi:L-alanine-DL-glutamate epimerase-like enolase superfamily enzyme